MSCMNSNEQRVFKVPRRRRTHVFKDPHCRVRNRRWLATQRQFGLTVGETAEYLNRPDRTVARGIAAALVEEQDEPAHFVATRAPLTEDELADLREEYAPGTALGDHPTVMAFLQEVA